MEIDRRVHILDSSTVNMLSNSQPIRILKRPPNLLSPEQVNGSNGCVKPPPVIKSLQQRELEYAEARLRIFGTPDSEEKLGTNKDQLDEVPRRIIKPTRKEGVIRYPRGPDGTKGFTARCRETLVVLNSTESDSSQFHLIADGLFERK